MSEEKYYLIDKEGDGDFEEFNMAMEVEKHILTISKETDCSLEDLRRDITIIRGKKINFTGRLIIGSIAIAG